MGWRLLLHTCVVRQTTGTGVKSLGANTDSRPGQVALGLSLSILKKGRNATGPGCWEALGWHSWYPSKAIHRGWGAHTSRPDPHLLLGAGVCLKQQPDMKPQPVRGKSGHTLAPLTCTEFLLRDLVQLWQQASPGRDIPAGSCLSNQGGKTREPEPSWHRTQGLEM